MDSKKLWESKTFWVNLIAGVGLLIQAVTGKEIVSLALQGQILAVVNVALRFITKQPVTWN